MKRILLLTASPRKKGNSFILAKAFSERAEEKGYEIVRFDTAFMKLRGCAACGNCFKFQRPCVYNDDFNKIADEMQKCDSCVFAAPVYFYSFPSQIKSVIDRLYCFDTANIKFSGKNSALISCCEDCGDSVFSGITYIYEETMKHLKFNNVGEVLIEGVGAAGEIKNTDGEEKARNLADII